MIEVGSVNFYSDCRGGLPPIRQAQIAGHTCATASASAGAASAWKDREGFPEGRRHPDMQALPAALTGRDWPINGQGVSRVVRRMPSALH